MTFNSLFEVKVSYDTIDSNDGRQKRQTDVYIIDAVSFGEAEQKAFEIVRPYATQGTTIASIKRARYSEVHESVIGDIWFKAKVYFVVIDQEKGTEKRIPSTILINAEDIEGARKNLVEAMRDTMSDYEIAKLEETPIINVIKYEK